MSTSSTTDRANPAIRRWIDVRSHPTVVRLANLDEEWIVESYHLTAEVENHLSSLRKVLDRPQGTGIFLIGPYGSGKSHFLAFVTRSIRRAELSPRSSAVVPISLLNYPAELALEKIVREALGIDQAPGDRRPAWARLQEREEQGVVLVLDELSEFLRSKPDAQRFNEDVRFLQYMGEWAMGNRFWVIAALQEQIEHTGEIERTLYRKIRDRYPLRYLLGPSHLRDLLGSAVLVRKEGYDAAIAQLEQRVEETLPAFGLDEGALRQVYPLHPATIDFLESIRDRFSQARGAVDFVTAQLAGKPERGIEPFLDRPWGEFLTPERIVHHFRDLLDVQSEFLPIAQRLFPYYEKNLATLFPAPARAALARRVVDLLILAHLTPDHDGVSAEQAARWLMIRASRTDPAKNVAIVEGVLRELRDRGRYVSRDGNIFRLDLDDDDIAAVERALATEKSELSGRKEALFERVAPELARRGIAPFDLPWEEWQSRRFRWHFHERHFAVYVGNDAPPPPPDIGPALCIRLPWGSAEGSGDLFVLRPAPIEPGPELLELAALLAVARRPWSKRARERLDARIDDRCSTLVARLRAAYLDAELISPRGERTPAQRAESSESGPWLEGLAIQMTRRIYPAFERFAPAEGPLPKRSYIELGRFANADDSLEGGGSDTIAVIREGYWVPMRLIERQGRGYKISATLDKHELVQLVTSRLDVEPAPEHLYQVAREPIFGLVDDQIDLLLLFLVFQGEIDLVKGRKSYRELYETLPRPIQYDRIVAGRALAVEELRALERLLDGLRMRRPDRWTVLAQRKTAGRIREIGGKTRAKLLVFAERLEKTEGANELVNEIREIMSTWTVLDTGSDEIAGLRLFLREIASPEQFVARMRELMQLPGRVDRLSSERQRFLFLFGHKGLETQSQPEMVAAVEELGDPPGIAAPDELARWIEGAEDLYARYEKAYARLHAQWWKEWIDRAAAWKPPAVARSRNLGIDTLMAQWSTTMACAEELKCRGLIDLRFQPICTCDFDGRRAPYADSVEELERLRGEIEGALGRFFDRREVRDRVGALTRDGIDDHPTLLQYVDGRASYPDTQDVERLDRRLAELDVVEAIDVGEVVDLLGGRTWSKEELRSEITAWVERRSSERLRFSSPDSAETREDLARWCAEQCLRGGTPLPPGFGAGDLATMAAAIRPDWVGRKASARLDELGLGRDAEDLVLGWLFEGTIPPPAKGKRTALVQTAGDAIRPAPPAPPAERAALLAELYRHHDRLSGPGGERWLAHLDEMASLPLDPEPLPLADLLRRNTDASWIVVDAMGAVLFEAIRAEIVDLFPGWRSGESTHALTVPATTTDAWYRSLADEGLNHAIEKIDRIDEMIHERFPGFDDLARLAVAELAIELRRIVSRLDTERPILLFADHGFRISRDGRSYRHGGGSVIERLVAPLLLVPR